MTANFSLGQTVITPGAMERLDQADIPRALLRHASGDWGALSEEDRRENELSVAQGFRVLSAYRDSHGTKFWIITEADRSVTTILLPEEY